MREHCHYKPDVSLMKNPMDIGYQCIQCHHSVVVQLDIQPEQRLCPAYYDKMFEKEEKETKEEKS